MSQRSFGEADAGPVSGVDGAPLLPQPVRVRLFGISQYLHSVWNYRYLWWSLATLDIRTRYRRSVLGLGWSLLHPLAMTAVICVFWSALWGIDPKDFAPSLMAGLTFWQFVTACAKDGCKSFTRGEAYIRQCPMPMAIYPLRVALVAAFHYLMALSAVLLLTWILQGFDTLLTLPVLIPAVASFIVFGWSLAVLTGLANLYFPDTSHITTIVLQVLFYVTPIIYEPERLRGHGMDWIVDFNPFAALLEIIRNPILHGQLPSAMAVGVGMAAILVALGCATAVLARLQHRIIFQL